MSGFSNSFIESLELGIDGLWYVKGTCFAPVLANFRLHGSVDDYMTGMSYASKDDWNARRGGVPI